MRRELFDLCKNFVTKILKQVSHYFFCTIIIYHNFIFQTSMMRTLPSQCVDKGVIISVTNARHFNCRY
jgi:hypothetical protein